MEYIKQEKTDKTCTYTRAKKYLRTRSDYDKSPKVVLQVWGFYYNLYYESIIASIKAESHTFAL